MSLAGTRYLSSGKEEKIVRVTKIGHTSRARNKKQETRNDYATFLSINNGIL
jgi:hypothetical protein